MAKASEFSRIRRERGESGVHPCDTHPWSKVEKEREDGMGMDTGDEGCLVCGDVWWRASRSDMSIDMDG